MNEPRQTIPPGFVQGESEDITYRVSTSRWGGSPSSAAVEVIRDSDDVDVTEFVVPTAPQTEDDDILVRVNGLENGELYYVNVAFTSGVNRLETFFTLYCK